MPQPHETVAAGCEGATGDPRHPGLQGRADSRNCPAAGSRARSTPSRNPAPPAGDPFAPNPSTSIYDQYGYAGLTWHTYDLGCGGSLRDPAAATDTMVGNVLLSSAVWLTAATNGLHNHVADPASYMGPLDRVVATVTDRLRAAIWSPWGAVAVLGVAAMLLFQAMRGHFSSVVAGAAWAALVLAVVAAVTQYPSRASSFFDDTITSTIGSIQARTAGVDTSPRPAGSRAHGPRAHSPSTGCSTTRGSAASSVRRTRQPLAAGGRTCSKASAVSRSEAAKATTPDDGQAARRRQGQQWGDIADEIQEQDPATYVVLQGKAGSRLGTGFMALFGAIFVDTFRLVADVFLLAGLVMLRLLVMFLPAAAVVGVFAPLSGVVRKMANIAGAAVVNVIAFSAGSVVYTAAITAVLGTADGARDGDHGTGHVPGHHGGGLRAHGSATVVHPDLRPPRSPGAWASARAAAHPLRRHPRRGERRHQAGAGSRPG